MKFEKYLVLLLFLIIAVLVVSCSSSETDEITGNVQAEEISTDSVDAETNLQDGTYVLDTQLSTLTYSAARIVGSSHIGTVGIKEGSVEVQDGQLKNGKFLIDLTTITESKDNARYLTHIKSADFFNIEMYPTSSFVMNSLVRLADGSYLITGDLTIKDQTHEIEFPATFEKNGDELGAIAEFTIDRTRWGITYDSGTVFQQIGDRAIKDEITYNLDLVFVK